MGVSMVYDSFDSAWKSVFVIKQQRETNLLEEAKWMTGESLDIASSCSWDRIGNKWSVRDGWYFQYLTGVDRSIAKEFTNFCHHLFKLSDTFMINGH